MGELQLQFNIVRGPIRLGNPYAGKPQRSACDGLLKGAGMQLLLHSCHCHNDAQ
jgi:hypothetical protein